MSRTRVGFSRRAKVTLNEKTAEKGEAGDRPLVVACVIWWCRTWKVDRAPAVANKTKKKDAKDRKTLSKEKQVFGIERWLTGEPVET